MTGDDKYSLLNSDNFYEINSDAIKQKTFSHFVSAFLQIRLNFNNFEKNILPLIAHVFQKLETAKRRG